MENKPIDQNEKRKKLIALLGDLPIKPEKVKAYSIGTEERETYTLERLTLELNGMEPVPAYFVKPKNTAGKLPVVLFNHSHGGNYQVGKDELLNGAAYLKKESYAEVLTKEGYGVLAIDAWCFGERKGRTETQVFKDMLWNGRVLFGMMAFDSMAAVDYLVSREDVDSSRLATLGMSMGGTMAWWLSALDTRIKVCVDICSLTDFHTLAELNGFDGHGVYYYIPGLLKHFTSSEINALIAPRPHLSLSGTYDNLVPYKGVLKIDKEISKIYKNYSASDKWQFKTYPCGHIETAEMRYEALTFLRKWL